VSKKKLKEKLEYLPVSSGVYLMKNFVGKIIYVGKAKILKNRIRSYFSGTPTDEKTAELISKIEDFDYILTKTEGQALELESNLIKKYRPKYNIALKDDKRYPFIKVSTNENFPRIFVTRKLAKDKAKYFAPYTDAKSVRKTLKLMEWIFPLRTCKRKILENGKKHERACINHQLGKCAAPCIGNISEENYRDIVRNAMRFLKGRNQEILDEMQKKMNIFSDKMQFEKAAELRDKIKNIQKINNSKNLFFMDQKNRDIIGIYKEDKHAAVSVLKILSGKLLNKEIYELENVEGRDIFQLMGAFIKQYYSAKLDNLPYSIFLQIEPEDFYSLNKWLHNSLYIPKRGEKKILSIIAKENAFNFVEEQKLKYLRKSNRTIFPIIELKDKLNLKKLPRKMICVDISTIQGTDTVSSLVFFENGKPQKKNYRHFIMKNVIGQDDFASMQETFSRYFAKIDQYEKPDLIVVDGGKGQLNAANKILKKSKISEIEIISLAKKMEEIFIPHRTESIILPKSSSALRVLIKIRDEAHRFAITFHRKKRASRTLISELDNISGIGDSVKFALLNEFGSVQNIRNANIVKLMRVKGIGEKTAKHILNKINLK